MHVYYKFGLLLIFLLAASLPQSSSLPTPEHTEYDDYYDEYNDYYDSVKNASLVGSPEAGAVPVVSSSSSSISPLEEQVSEEEFDTDAEIEVPKRNHAYDEEEPCPTECICTDENQFVHCAHMHLRRVPKTMPRTALKIDLSHNSIESISSQDFENCTRLREIVLADNLIRNVSKEAFVGLDKLDTLSLANNLLTTLDPSVFSTVPDLAKLDLSNNSIVLPKNEPFLKQPGLQELLLRNASLTEIYEETFHNLSGLTSLKMDLNNFGKKINTKAFEPMKNLIKLKLPELETDAIRELCNVLKLIDNISLKRFDISCLELVLGTSFNESLILATDPPAAKPTSPPTVKTSTTTTTRTPNSAEKSIATGSTTRHVPIPEVTSTRKTNFSRNTMSDNPLGMPKRNQSDSLEEEEISVRTAGFDGEDVTEKTYQVPISSEAINYILISIIIIASIGILIGILCRKDVGGVKTKCCRSRRPLPTDQVRPAEEIPLNKVV